MTGCHFCVFFILTFFTTVICFWLCGCMLHFQLNSCHRISLKGNDRMCCLLYSEFPENELEICACFKCSFWDIFFVSNVIRLLQVYFAALGKLVVKFGGGTNFRNVLTAFLRHSNKGGNFQWALWGWTRGSGGGSPQRGPWAEPLVGPKLNTLLKG